MPKKKTDPYHYFVSYHSPKGFGYSHCTLYYPIRTMNDVLEVAKHIAEDLGVIRVVVINWKELEGEEDV